MVLIIKPFSMLQHSGFITYIMNNIWIRLDVMVQHQDGESSEHLYLNETTTPATTVELLQLIRATISHPSTKGAQMNSVISLLLVQLATTLKAQKPNNNTTENE
jgi:hypothetical protein